MVIIGETRCWPGTIPGNYDSCCFQGRLSVGLPWIVGLTMSWISAIRRIELIGARVHSMLRWLISNVIPLRVQIHREKKRVDLPDVARRGSANRKPEPRAALSLKSTLVDRGPVTAGVSRATQVF